MADKFDLVVIGSGNAGYHPAIRASQLGMSVALIEKESYLGGTCLNWGCIPTKALLQSASMLSNLKQHGEQFGIMADGVEFDYSKANEHKGQVVGQLQKGVQGLMKKNKVQVFTGVGSFVEPKKIKVEGEDGEQELEAENVLISTGSGVKSLPGMEFDGEKVISSDDVISAESYPSSVIILGSGAVGVEFASMYNDFGTDVTIVEMLDRIVPLEDPEISKTLQKEFEDRDIRILTSTKADPESLEKTDDGVKINAETEDGEETLEAEAILVAVGRKTVTEDLNLDGIGLELNDDGTIPADEYGQTSVDGVYAAGDVIGGYWLAHAASHEGIIAVEHMAGEDPLPMDQTLVPRVTFCRPEVASFGLTKAEAEEEGYEAKEASFPFQAIGKALIEGEPNGFVKIVADEETNLLLGMHAIGPHVTDLIAEGVFAKLVEGTPQEIGMAIHAHPSLSEVIGEAAMAVDGNAIHV
ncbi:MAG: dihydrolipoyl dehydrogenase [Rubrobacteraceae bacterium]